MRTAEEIATVIAAAYGDVEGMRERVIHERLIRFVASIQTEALEEAAKVCTDIGGIYWNDCRDVILQLAAKVKEGK